jgi:undecaprenyl-diphosphatase
MEAYLHALVLGIIQGLTEFLPVSSSGHLELGKYLLGFEADSEESLLFTVVVHAATALSTVVIFRKDIGSIFTGIFRGNPEDLQFAGKVILSMVPAAVVGLVFLDQLEALFNGQIVFVGAMLLLTGALLLWANRAKKTHKNVGFLDAGIIGISQAIAILPGISRSGATIATAVLLGIDREKAARFSFLMVVPLILGKMLVDTKSMLEMGSTGGEGALLPLLVGFLAAFFTGLWACQAMISFVKKAKLRGFAIYCFAVGSLALASAWW